MIQKSMIHRFKAYTLITVTGLLFLSASPVAASKPPLPNSKTQALDTLKEQIQSEKEKKATLATKLKSAEDKLEEVKAQLVDISRSVRDNEQLLASLEKRIAKLGDEKEALHTKLEKDYANVSDLLLALQRIRRVPPEALVIRPGAPLETAQSALILKTILPAIHSRATQLSADLHRLSSLEENLHRNKQTAMQTKFVLNQKYKEVEALSAKRQGYYKQINSNYQETVASLDKMAKEAESLEDLVKKLAKEKARAQKNQAEKLEAQKRLAGRVSAIKKPNEWLTKSKNSHNIGQAQLPVSGAIIIGYGETDKIGAASQGIRIQGPPGGLVVAPLKGRVQFAGSFKNYGQLVILEHANGYHSLIGGMDNVTVSVGETLDAGEPLGKLTMPPSRTQAITVYYELRHKGRPVNPSRKFASLKT